MKTLVMLMFALLNSAKQSGSLITPEAATKAALVRIERDDARIRAVISLNPNALAEARQAASGPLSGQPVLVKDNIDVAGLATTAGSLALKLNLAHADAPVIARLRAAGATILGKTNLSEWANFRSTTASSGWSAVGGLTRNPWDPSRTACGSSSGSAAAVAAGYVDMAVGTETDGSVVCPASVNGVVGVKPTLGLVSRTGVVPISAAQDTPGAMATTVRDAARLLTAMAGSDLADPATADADAHRIDYAAALLAGRIAGARIGVLRDRVGSQPAVAALFDRSLALLAAQGAVLVEIPDSRIDKGLGELENKALIAEFKTAINHYLAATPPEVATRSLAQLIAFNRAHADTELAWFGQELFEQAEASSGPADPANARARARARQLAGADGIDRLLREANVAMLIQPTQGLAWLIDPINGDSPAGASASDLPAIAGYPHVTVPMGLARGLPAGLSFIGPRWSEAALLQAAYVFERARGPMPRPPAFPKP